MGEVEDGLQKGVGPALVDQVVEEDYVAVVPGQVQVGDGVD